VDISSFLPALDGIHAFLLSQHANGALVGSHVRAGGCQRGGILAMARQELHAFSQWGPVVGGGR
jgi:hypothetical protein